jgi:hypothetical protein
MFSSQPSVCCPLAAAIGVMQLGMQKRAEFLLTICGSAGVCRNDHGKHQASSSITPVLRFLEVQAIEALQDRGTVSCLVGSLVCNGVVLPWLAGCAV